MKKTFLKQLFYALIIAFSLIGCDKDADLIENPENINANNSYKKPPSNEIDNKLADYIREYNGKLVAVNFIGRIINENDEPIEGARVTLGGQVKETDQNGIVSFTNAQIQEHFAHARAFAEGYLDGSRVMVPNFDEGNQNNFTIKLFRFNNVARINSEEGGKISFESEIGEGFVYFNPGFTDESGNEYHGDVAVSINYLDPLNPDTANTMPGDLYGITQDFEQVALGSYGMIQVELRGASGEKLQIIDSARLIMPIHPDQIATAENEVPMWSFNEHAGVWYEETIAHRDGNHYVTEVPHFSFWNCDAPFPVVNFSATVIDTVTSNPLAGLRVEIEYNGFIRFATTDNNGFVSGKVPANQTIIIRVFDDCGNLLYSNSYLTPNVPISFLISVTPNPLQTFSLSGTVNDCIPAPVTNGYLTLTNSLTGQYITTILVGGTYMYTGIDCSLSTDITITAVDLSAAQGSTTTTTVDPGPNTQNIVICGGLPNEYIRYRINGGSWQHDLLNPSGGIGSNNVVVQAFNGTAVTQIFSNTITLGSGYPFGTGPNSMYIETLSDINGLNGNATLALGTPNPLTFDLIDITPGPLGIGTYISIDFAGNYLDNSGTIKTIEGEARIYRDY